MKKIWQKFYGAISFAFRVLFVSVKRYCADQHKERAVALTYYTLFAIVPLAALSFGIAKGFDIESRLRLVLNERFGQHEELLKYVYQFADTTLKQSSGGLVAGVGVFALIWTVMWLAGNIEKAFNSVWGLPARKNIFRKFSDYLSIVLLLPIILVVLGSAGVFLRAFFKNLEEKLSFLGSTPGYALNLAGNLTPLLISILLFTVIYFTSPNTKVRFLPAFFAGIVAGVFFQALQDGFFYLQGSIYRYNRIYGSFAALPLFLIWLQWSWQIALFGAEIGFVAQKLDTGLFDESAMEKFSLRSRRVLQLALAAFIYKKFESGKGASEFGELLSEMKVSTFRLSAELSFLVDAGILFRGVSQNREQTYLPALPSGTTVKECCLKLDHTGMDDNFDFSSVEALKNFDEADKICASNKKIFEL